MTFGFLVGSRNFVWLFWVSWEISVLQEVDWVHAHIDDCYAIHFLHRIVIRCDQATKMFPLVAWLHQLVFCKKPSIFSSSSRYRNLEFPADGPVWNLGVKTVSGIWRSPHVTAPSVFVSSGVFFRYVRNPRIESSWVEWWRRRRWICKKRFPINHAYCKYLAAYLLRLGISPGSR